MTLVAFTVNYLALWIQWVPMFLFHIISLHALMWMDITLLIFHYFICAQRNCWETTKSCISAKSYISNNLTLVSLMYCVLQVTVPSLASVYNEYALKSQFDTSIYLQVFLNCLLRLVRSIPSKLTKENEGEKGNKTNDCIRVCACEREREWELVAKEKTGLYFLLVSKYST